MTLVLKDRRFFPLAALQSNLRRLLKIRWIVFGCQALALAYAWLVLELALQYLLISIILSFFVLLNLAVSWRLHKGWLVSESEFLGHLLLDVAGLSLLLYLSGGANNPFVSYLLVPVIISAAALPWSYTWVVAGSSLTCYTLLLFIYQPLPELLPGPLGHGQDHGMAAMVGATGNLHMLGMWFNFVVSTVLITWFVVKMATEIRSQDALLARLREDSLRDEQIVAIAIQAAGTAHELGTPLSTMAVLLQDMRHEYADDPALQKNLALLREQIGHCKTSLRQLVSEADYSQAQAAPRLSLPLFLDSVLDRWQLLRPEVKINLAVSQETDIPWLKDDASLRQALINLLDNAADASPDGIDLTLHWNTREWELEIRDYGSGITPVIAAGPGHNLLSTKPDGMGVGLMLSQASINRLGGTVKLHAHPGQGTVTRVKIPLDACHGQ
ncbi:MAG: ATP-binding protein [Pseudomonadales bacterium]|nr:ATP-binding protein [Pseudomonadales bacterium]